MKVSDKYCHAVGFVGNCFIGNLFSGWNVYRHCFGGTYDNGKGGGQAIRTFKKGEKYRPVVVVLKTKKGKPTVIRVSGREYQLRLAGHTKKRK